MSNLSVEEFEQLRRNVEKAKQRRDRASGAYEAMLKKLKEDHGLDSLQEAENEIANLKVKLEKEVQSFEEALDRFKTEYLGKLE